MGELLAAAAMNYGGRIVEIDHPTGRIRHLAGPAFDILTDIGLPLKVGDSPSLAELRRFTDRMADMTVELLEGTASPLAQKLYLTPSRPGFQPGNGFNAVRGHRLLLFPSNRDFHRF